jgi:hypothetical protein
VRSLSWPEVAARYREVEAEDLWGYEPIVVRARHVRRTQGRSTPGSKASDYLALSVHNDPYYVSTHKNWAMAHWVEQVYPQLGFTRLAHIRAVHYRIRIATTYTFPRFNSVGTVTERVSYSANHGEGWSFLQEAVGAARYLGTLAWDRIVDNRNPPPKTRPTADQREATLSVVPSGVVTVDEIEAVCLEDALPEVPDLPELPEVEAMVDERPPTGAPDAPDSDDLARYQIDTYFSTQRYYVEVGCEKSTMDDVLLPGAKAITPCSSPARAR